MGSWYGASLNPPGKWQPPNPLMHMGQLLGHRPSITTPTSTAFPLIFDEITSLREHSMNHRATCFLHSSAKQASKQASVTIVDRRSSTSGPPMPHHWEPTKRANTGPKTTKNKNNPDTWRMPHLHALPKGVALCHPPFGSNEPWSWASRIKAVRGRATMYLASHPLQ